MRIQSKGRVVRISFDVNEAVAGPILIDLVEKGVDNMHFSPVVDVPFEKNTPSRQGQRTNLDLPAIAQDVILKRKAAGQPSFKPTDLGNYPNSQRAYMVKRLVEANLIKKVGHGAYVIL